MTNTWLVSDTHFSHSNVTTLFKRNDGYPLRPFSSAEEMDEAIVSNWNSVVDDQDRVYHLGDFCMSHKAIPRIMPRLKGRIVLIKGNHDIAKLSQYTPWFDDIRSYVVKKTKEGGKMILCHVPVHKECLGRFGVNIHGHLHSNHIQDPDYLNVSVEQTNFMPISLNECFERIEENQKHFKQTGQVIDYSERYVRK